MEKEDIAMKDTRKNPLSFETCMDILDWFNDDTHIIYANLSPYAHVST